MYILRHWKLANEKSLGSQLYPLIGFSEAMSGMSDHKRKKVVEWWDKVTNHKLKEPIVEFSEFFF